MLRNRSSNPPPSSRGTSQTANEDLKHNHNRYPNLTIALWFVISVIVIVVFASAVTHDFAVPPIESSGQRNTNPKEKKPFEHERGYGDGKKFTPCPKENKKTFWMEKKKINQPVARALRMQGWSKTDDEENAQVLWSYSADSDWFDKLKPWQRYNHIPKSNTWNSKDTFVTFMLEYSRKSGKELPSLPETYRLDQEEELKKFKRRLFHDGGMDIPWVLKKPNVNQGRGITMLGPNTDELKNVLKTVKDEEGEQNYIIQRYVCNEMTIDNRKFDFRVFWIVASLDPLIIMYHDGYVRIGNSIYNEADFSNTRAHLTTHTGLAAEGKGTWENFADYVKEAAKKNAKLSKLKDPMLHVKNQVKQVLGEMGEAFKEVTFNAKLISSENGFGFYGADFIIDWDLDVFFIEPQHGCGLDEDHQFRVDMHNSLFTEMIDATEEIWERQERGLPTANKNLRNMGSYEIVYNDGWMFEYEGYVRSKDKKGCEIAKTTKKKRKAL